MFEHRDKKFFIGLIILMVIGPLIIMIWDIKCGALSLAIGIVIAARTLRAMQAAKIDEALREEKSLYARQDKGRTIQVQLVDDDGNELDSETAKARLEAAKLQAGPRDIVVGVRHKV